MAMDKETEKYFEQFPELKDVVFDSSDVPTWRQMRYAYNLGIDLHNASFASISQAIDDAKSRNVRANFKMSELAAQAIYDEIQERTFNRPLTKHERIGWLYYLHILLPEDTILPYIGHVEGYFLNFDNGFRCPHCKRNIKCLDIWQNDFEIKKCPFCGRSLSDVAWPIQFGPRGGVTVQEPVFFDLEIPKGFDMEKFKPEIIKNNWMSNGNSNPPAVLNNQQRVKGNNTAAGCGSTVILIIVLLLAYFLFCS